MSLRVYEYKGCGTCRKALKFLDDNKISYEKIAIREKPPSKAELKKMLKHYDGDSKKLFNTSGGDYKELGLKDKLSTMTIDKQIELLSSNGNLVKRPFILGEGWGLVGFKEEEWKIKIS
jgi:arsenate reductase (glutaredoxin)